MNKKILLGVLVIISLFLVTGCDNTTSSTYDQNAFVLHYGDTSYAATLKKEDNQNFILYSKDKTTYMYEKLTISNKNLNILFDLRFTDVTKEEYDLLNESRKTAAEYKEYTWNGYKGYSYDGNNYNISYVILVDDANEQRYKIVQGSLSYYNKENSNVTDAFKSDEFQKFINTIEYK